MAEEKGLISDDIKGLDDDIADVTLTLVSKDGQRFEVERSVLMQSDLIKKLTETDKEATEFPLLHVNGAIVEKVVKYMRYHHNNPAKDIEKPLKSSNMREVADDPWDAEFVDVPQSVLFDMILAANYMVVRPMLDLTCAKVATMLKGKSPEEIRKLFNIVNDFTPEEEEAVRAENKWADES